MRLNQHVLISTSVDETSVDESAELAVKLFGDPLRAEIVRLLAAEQLCTCHLVDETGARQTNVSNHLRALREAGLVESKPAGRYTYHRLVPEALEELASRLASLGESARGTSDLRRPSCD